MFRARAPRLLIVVASALVLLVLGASPASAHTELEATSPTAGATVERLTTIELRFSDPIVLEASHVYVQDDGGYLDLAPLANIDGDPATLTATVPPLGDGAYELTWHVLAEDGDPAQGTFTVTVAPAAVSAPPVAGVVDPAADAPPDTSLAQEVDVPLRGKVVTELPSHGHGPGDMTNTMARGVLDASLATLVGGLAFVGAVWPPAARLARTRNLLWFAAIVAAVASFELAGFQHAAATGLSTAQALAPWRGIL